MLDCEAQLVRYSSALLLPAMAQRRRMGRRATTDSRAAACSPFLAHPLRLTPTPMLFSHFCHTALCVGKWWTVCWTQKEHKKRKKPHQFPILIMHATTECHIQKCRNTLTFGTSSRYRNYLKWDMMKSTSSLPSNWCLLIIHTPT